MDIQLPKRLENTLIWILDQYKVQSWRFTCENRMTLSIRFIDEANTATSTPQPVLQTTHGQPTVYNHSYRRKPPSSQNRDSKRMQLWNNINHQTLIIL